MSVHDNFDLQGFLKGKKLLKENQESKESTKWSNLEDEMKWELLCSAVPPREAEKFIELGWNEIPEEVTSKIDWSIESAGQELDESVDDHIGIYYDIEKNLDETTPEKGIDYLKNLIRWCERKIKSLENE